MARLIKNPVTIIKSGGSSEYIAPYGNLYYHYVLPGWSVELDTCYDGNATVEVVDINAFWQFLSSNPTPLQNQLYYAFWDDQSNQWMLQWEDACSGNQTTTYYSTDQDLEYDTGIRVTWSGEPGETRQYISFLFQNFVWVDDNQKGGVFYVETLEQFNKLVPGESTHFANGWSVYCDLIPVQAVYDYKFGSSTPATIPDRFLYNSYLENDIVFPEGVTTIGNTVLSLCSKLKNIVVPSTVTSIGTSFAGGTDQLQTLTVNTNVSPTDSQSVSVYSSYAQAYQNGVTVYGSGRSSWMANLPNIATSRYRKLIDGGH